MKDGRKKMVIVTLVIALVASVILAAILSGGKKNDSNQAVSTSSESSSIADDDQDSKEMNKKKTEEKEDTEIAFEGESDDEFVFNKDYQNYKFTNKEKFTVKTKDGYRFSAGVDENDKGASKVKEGILLNLHFSGEKDHAYGVQVSEELKSVGSLAVGIDGKLEYLTTTDWNSPEQLPISKKETLLFYRTWDQRLHQEYKNRKDYGLVWTYDDKEAYASDLTIWAKVCDYSDYSCVGLFKITISYNEKTKEYYLGNVEENPLCSLYKNDSDFKGMEKKVRSYVAPAAIRLLKTGVFYYNDALEDESITDDDIIIQDVSDCFWSEISGFYGDVMTSGNITSDGMLVAVTFKHTTTTHGPITVYYSVEPKFDYDNKKISFVYDTPELIGYDFYGERSWSTFASVNGFNASPDSEKVKNSKTVNMYRPSYLP